MSTTYTDLRYTEEKGVATITINRPKVMNAFNAHTVEELIQAFLKAGWDKKKAREIWYMCRRYSAQEALAMGLCNVVVPHDQLDAEVAKWCAELMEKSPTALAIAKRSFNADSENIRGIGALGMQALALYYQTEESKEGGNAFREKRKANFRSKLK